MLSRIVGLCLVAAGCVGDVPETPGGQTGSAADGSGAGTGTQSSVSPLGYLQRIAAIQCEQAFSCRDTFPGDLTTFEAVWGTSVTACTNDLLTAWNTRAIEDEIAKGRVEFDGTAAVSCLGGVAFGSCAEHWQDGIQWADACYSVLVGNVPTGGSCDMDYACTSYSCDLATRRCL